MLFFTVCVVEEVTLSILSFSLLPRSIESIEEEDDEFSELIGNGR